MDVGSVWNDSWDGAPGETSNVALLASVSEGADAVSVYPTPAVSIVSPANVATPSIGLAVVVPRSVAFVGLVPSAMRIGPMALVNGVPEAVWTITWMAGEIAVPAMVAVGWVVKTSRGGAASVGVWHELKRKGAAALAIPTTALVARLLIRRRIPPPGATASVLQSWVGAGTSTR